MLTWLDDDLNGRVCIDEFLKWHTMAFKVRILSPTYGNTPWSAASNEPQLTPNTSHGRSKKNLEIAEVSEKLERVRQLAEEDLKRQPGQPSSPRRLVFRGGGNRIGPHFAQAVPTGSLLDTIEEVDELECSDDRGSTALSVGPGKTYWMRRRPKAHLKTTEGTQSRERTSST